MTVRYDISLEGSVPGMFLNVGGDLPRRGEAYHIEDTQTKTVTIYRVKDVQNRAKTIGNVLKPGKPLVKLVLQRHQD